MAPVADWRAYLTWDTENLIRRLAEVAQALSQLHEEMGSVRAQEKQAKVQGFSRAQGESVTARVHYADANAVTATTEVFSIDAQIKGLLEEQGLIRLVLENRDALTD